MNISIRDAYTILCIKPGISEQELKDTYRVQIKLHHPDRHDKSKLIEKTELTMRINAAYSLIVKSGLNSSKSFFNQAQQQAHDNAQQAQLNPDEYWIDKAGVRTKITNLGTMQLVAIKKFIETTDFIPKSKQYDNIVKELNTRQAVITKGKIKIKF